MSYSRSCAAGRGFMIHVTRGLLPNVNRVVLRRITRRRSTRWCRLLGGARGGQALVYRHWYFPRVISSELRARQVAHVVTCSRRFRPAWWRRSSSKHRRRAMLRRSSLPSLALAITGLVSSNAVGACTDEWHRRRARTRPSASLAPLSGVTSA